MTREYAYLSFFKSKKIDYIYKPKEKEIIFACIHCSMRAYMNCQTSKWRCMNCKEDGNILGLIKHSENYGFANIYLPKKEKRSIFQMLDRISKKYPADHERLHNLKDKIEKLINHYENTTG